MASDSSSASSESRTRPPTWGEKAFDKSFRSLTWVLAWIVALLMVVIIIQIGQKSLPAFNHFGLDLLAGTEWNPPRSEFGLLPQIWGTIYSSIIALLFGTILGVSAAVFITEDFIPEKIRTVLKNIIELLAAIPSIIYGMWGIYVLVPLINEPANWLHEHMGWFPLFSTPFTSRGMLPAVIVLTIMILPTITAISRDALASVPRKLREGAYGLGATRWETIFKVVLPTASGGIFGAVILGFGRALGETMALAMLVGNSEKISVSIFAAADTLAARMANKFNDATSLEKSTLLAAGLVLLVITLLVNIIGAWIIKRTAVRGLK